MYILSNSLSKVSRLLFVVQRETQADHSTKPGVRS